MNKNPLIVDLAQKEIIKEELVCEELIFNKEDVIDISTVPTEYINFDSEPEMAKLYTRRIGKPKIPNKKVKRKIVAKSRKINRK